jgi:threonine efflux protein
MLASYSVLIPIALALAVAVVIPGPNVLAVTSTAIRDRRAGIQMGLGVATGDMLWAVSALVGLGAALAHARPAFEALRWLGAAYLLWFAWRMWRAPVNDVGPAEVVGPSRHTFARGIIVDLANPKAAIFFTTLFASLVPVQLDVRLGLLVVATVASIVYGWYLTLALVFSRPSVQDLYRRAARKVNRVAAGAIGVLGVRLVVGEA